MRCLLRRRKTLLVLLAISLVSARLITGCGDGMSILTDGGSAGGVNWSDWSYRRSVTISNGGATTETDYQVNINLTSGNFTFANADPAGNDLRFNYNGTSLPYWIESWIAGTSASIWVKIPSLPSGNTVIYLYYGNPGLTSESNFDNTFTKDSGFSGLAAQWHMDEGTGNSTIYDTTANNNDGTITGAVWAVADGGRWYTSTTAGFSTGDSLSLDGTDDYVVVTDSASLDVSKLTIALWFKPGAVASGYLVSKWNTDANNRSYSVFLNGGKVAFDTSTDGSGFVPLLSTSSVSAGNWYHVAVVFDGAASSKIIYINGTSDKIDGTVSGNLFNSSSDLTMGILDVGGANYFTGVIDEVSIYNRALSADEVKALSQRRKYSADIDGTAPAVGGEESVP